MLADIRKCLMRALIFLVACSNGLKTDEISMGTTLVALKFDGGVVVAADSRTSAGVMVSNKFAKKIDVLVDQNAVSCVICRSGSAADTQFLAREAKQEFRSRYWRYDFRKPMVSQVAHFLRNKMRSESTSRDFQASLICAGYDDEGGRIFGIAIGGGAMWEEDVFCVSGSGSTFLIGYLDSLNLDPSHLQTEEETVELAERLLALSISRDGASGGLIRVFTMKRGGIEEKVVYPKMAPIAKLPGFVQAAIPKKPQLS